MADPAGTRHLRLWLRLVAVAAGLLAIAGVAAAVVLPRLVDVNTWRSSIEAKASARLGRPVSLGQMTLRVFPTLAVVIRDVTVGGDGSADKPALTASSVGASARLWPLVFSRRLEVTALALDHPTIVLARDANGIWNWQRMFEQQGPTPGVAVATEGSSFTLEDLDIAQGTLHVSDAALPTGARTFSVNELDLALRGFRAGHPFAVDVAGKLVASEGSGALRFKGDAGPLPRPFVATGVPLEGRVTADAFPLAAVLPYIRSQNGIRSLTGKVASDVTLRIRPGEETAAKGSVGLDHVHFEVDGTPSRSATLDLRGAIDLSATKGGEDVEIRKLELTLPQGSLALSGRLKNVGEGSDVAMSLDGKGARMQDLEPLLALAGIDFLRGAGVQAGKGSIDLATSIRGRMPERLAIQGKLHLNGVGLNLPKPEGGTLERTVHGDVTLDAIAAQGGKLVTLSACTVTLPSGTFSLSGTLDQRSGRPIADLALAPARVRVEDLQAVASLVGLALPGTLASPDPVEIALGIRGDLGDRSRLGIDGTLKVSRLTLDTPYFGRPLEKIEATVRFTGNGLETKGLSAVLGATPVRGDFVIRNLAQPDVTFALGCDRAALGELLASLSPRTTAAAGNGSTSGAARAGVHAQGTLAIGTGSAGTLAFADLHAGVEVDGRALTLAPLRFALYGGRYDGETTVDLSGVPSFSHTCALSGVDMNALLTANTNFKNSLYGTLAGKMRVAGSGSSRDEIARNLSGTGELAITNGKLLRLSVMKGLADVAGLFGEQTIHQLSGKLAANQTAFSRLTSTLRIANGQVMTDNLVLESDDVTLRASGSFTLDGHLGIRGRLVFSDAITRSLEQEGSRAVYLGKEQGRIAIPLTVGGTLDHPSYGVDFQTAGAYAVQKALTDKLLDRLGLNEPKIAPPSATPPVPPAARPVTPGLGVRIDSHRLRGNLLRPDLAVAGAVSGSRLQGLLVVVSDENGHELLRKMQLVPEIAAAYGSRPRSETLSIPFAILIPGGELRVGAKAYNVTLSAVSDSGAVASASFAEKAGLLGSLL